MLSSDTNNPRLARALRAAGQYKCREFPPSTVPPVTALSFLHVVAKLLPRDVSEEEDHERTAYLLSLMKKVGPLGWLHVERWKSVLFTRSHLGKTTFLDLDIFSQPWY